jgi:hypothetical protein
MISLCALFWCIRIATSAGRKQCRSWQHKLWRSASTVKPINKQTKHINTSTCTLVANVSCRLHSIVCIAGVVDARGRCAFVWLQCQLVVRVLQCTCSSACSRLYSHMTAAAATAAGVCCSCCASCVGQTICLCHQRATATAVVKAVDAPAAAVVSAVTSAAKSNVTASTVK